VFLVSFQVQARTLGLTSDVIGAIDWAIARARFNLRVISLSLGHPAFEAAADDPLCQAVGARSRGWWWWRRRGTSGSWTTARRSRRDQSPAPRRSRSRWGAQHEGTEAVGIDIRAPAAGAIGTLKPARRQE
jgi:hypothetical protein